MNLSINFTLEELTKTSTGLPNQPSAEEIARLTDLCASLLQPIRDAWGVLHIDSGFRCKEVNEKVGGVSTSQHCKGEAADIVPLDADIDRVYEWIIKMSGLKFGQCILEDKHDMRWIHISTERGDSPNQQALVYNGKTYEIYKGEHNAGRGAPGIGGV